MVAVLVALKLRLLRNSIRTSVWKLVGLVLGGLYAVGLVVLVVAGLVALRFASVEVAANVTTVAFAALTLGWLVMSLLVVGMDQTVDPARFALLPLSARQLLPGLFLTSLIGIPGAATVLVCLGLLVTWSVSVPAFLAAVVSIVLGVALCILLTRALSAALAQVLATRRTRDLTVVLTMVVVLGLSLGLQGVSRAVQAVADRQPLMLLDRIADVVGWTPFGWIWAVPGLVAQGDWLGAGLRLLLTLALEAGLVGVWAWAVARNLTSPIETGGGSKVHLARATPRGLLPAGPAGAIAGRSLLYWRRDPRYLVSVVSLVMLPVLVAAPVLLNTGIDRSFVAFAPVLIAWVAGASIVSDLAYDGSALAHEALSGVTGRDDRLGRLWAYALVEGGILVVITVLSLVVAGEPGLAPTVVALSVALMANGLGAGLWVGSIIPGKAPAPGSSPFAAGNSGGLKAMLAFGASSGLAIASSLPVIGLLIGSLWVPALVWVALVVAVAGGAVWLWVGVHHGGRRLDRHWPEVYAAVTES